MPRLDTPAGAPGFATDGSQYLTFALGGEEYGVEILKVQEIRGYAPITPIPNTPAHITGVMNLRGTIIPVVDLRRALAMPATEYTPFTVIVVVSVQTRLMGLIVDAVSDVLDIARAAIQPPPDFGTEVDARFIRGMARAGDKLVILLDIERVLGGAADVAVP
jgi:purine-binding chemotaxis protein CheW